MGSTHLIYPQPRVGLMSLYDDSKGVNNAVSSHADYCINNTVASPSYG